MWYRHSHRPAGKQPRKSKSPLARGGFCIAGAGFEPATFGLWVAAETQALTERSDVVVDQLRAGVGVRRPAGDQRPLGRASRVDQHDDAGGRRVRGVGPRSATRRRHVAAPSWPLRVVRRPPFSGSSTDLPRHGPAAQRGRTAPRQRIPAKCASLMPSACRAYRLSNRVCGFASRNTWRAAPDRDVRSRGMTPVADSRGSGSCRIRPCRSNSRERREAAGQTGRLDSGARSDPNRCTKMRIYFVRSGLRPPTSMYPTMK